MMDDKVVLADTNVLLSATAPLRIRFASEIEVVDLAVLDDVRI